MRILVAVDGSAYSLRAVRNLVEHADWYREPPEVELVYVNPPLPYGGRAESVLGRKRIDRYHREEGETALRGARKQLAAAGIRHVDHVLVGPVAESIVRLARTRKCDVILIGTHGRSAAGNLLLGSVANKVLHLATVPVQLVR
jgi:nucleotide-binding universal stress UspA family protein